MYGRLLVKRGNLDPQQEAPEESVLEAAWGSDGEKLSGKIHVTQKIGRGHAPPICGLECSSRVLQFLGTPNQLPACENHAGPARGGISGGGGPCKPMDGFMKVVGGKNCWKPRVFPIGFPMIFRSKHILSLFYHIKIWFSHGFP